MNEIYTTQYCPWCQRAKAVLKERGIEYQEIDVTEDRDLQQLMIERSGKQSVPQIYINGEHIGGFDDLVQHLNTIPAAAA
ncbi:MAG: glutaredoxin 3 [Gammaproteobacteria bacterium]|nr:glutaredoxin 3 [Gammaproteobacteria bacterium]